MKKNDIIRLEITDMGVNGEGIGRVDGYAFFVKDALAGDTVDAVITKMNKGYGFAKTVNIVIPSKDRVEPLCPDAARCGGCQVMQLSYQAQLRIKEDKVRNDLVRLGGQDPETLVVRPVIGMSEPAVSENEASENETTGSETPGQATSGGRESYVPVRFRNKAQFPVGRDRDGRVVTGFYAGRTHYIIGTEKCLICQESMDKLTASVREFITEEGLSVYDEKTGQGLVRHVLIREGTKTGQVMVCLVINGSSLQAGGTGEKAGKKAFDETGSVNNRIEENFVNKLLAADIAPAGITSICLNENRKNTNVILGDKIRVLYGDEFIEDRIGDLTFRISPLSFYQVNSEQTEKLYGKALEYAGLTGDEIVWDLYCGTGTISLFLARAARKVYGVEIVPEAIENARVNAEINGITNAEFFCGKSEEVFPKMYASGGNNEDNCAGIPGQAGSPVQSEETGSPALTGHAGMPEANCINTACKAEHPDVVVLDPPRKGCDGALLEAILSVEPERIVYVSCNSATLARDIKILGEKYKLEEATPVDMFPHSLHIEVVVTLSRTEGTKRAL